MIFFKSTGCYATIRNNQDKELKFNLKDFNIKAGDQVHTPTAYLFNTPVFVATSEDRKFEVQPKKETEMRAGFAGVSKLIVKLKFQFLDIPEISIDKPSDI